MYVMLHGIFVAVSRQLREILCSESDGTNSQPSGVPDDDIARKEVSMTYTQQAPC